VLARPLTFRYELEREFAKPYGEPSEETPTSWLPRLIALNKIKPETRIWVQGWPDWYEYQDCTGVFGVPESGALGVRPWQRQQQCSHVAH
jgi:hypothetical protein